ncbi:MAG: BamA/TamA family outer membrane protein [Pseudomonadota bacterium]
MLACVAGFFAAAVANAQELRLTPQNKKLAEDLFPEALVLQVEEDATAADVIAAARGDYERLLAALYAEGYFSATISITLAGREAAALSALRAPESVSPAIVSINTGAQFVYGTASIAPLAPNTTAGEDFQPGEPAGTGDIRAAVEQAIDDWREASHAKARVAAQEIIARHSDAELDVSLEVAPGPPLTFGRLVVPEDGAVRPGRLRTIAGLPSGQPFNPDALVLARSRLVATGAFNSVVLREADEIGPGDTLDIGVEIEDAPPRRLGFGAEIETDEGIAVEAFWMHRNIFGGAENLRFDAAISGIAGRNGGPDFQVRGTLRIPGFRRADDTLVFTGNLESLNEPVFEEELLEFGVRRARQVNKELEIGVSLGVRISETTDDLGTRTFRHFIGNIDATRDRRDNVFNPKAGNFLFAQVQPFVGFSGSGTGVKLEGDARAYRSLGTRTVAAGRVRIGSIFGTEIIDTPSDFLFFSGGGGSVRGQRFQSLGVFDGTNTTGGRGFANVSLELRRDISRSFGVVGFVDYGFVSESGSFSDGGNHMGGGLGVRYNTALGPLRLDVGVPIGGASDEDTSYQLFIGLGQAF